MGTPDGADVQPNKDNGADTVILDDNIGHCAESRALAMARKHIRKHFPQIKGLITYTSSAQGHTGTIYSADGWFAVGRTRARPWSKAGRKNIDTSYKTRWVRSV